MKETLSYMYAALLSHSVMENSPPMGTMAFMYVSRDRLAEGTTPVRT